MPTKFQLITELYDQTVQSVTGSYQSWTGFLRAACYNYKCPFKSVDIRKQAKTQ